jgi:hypothetical protein
MRGKHNLQIEKVGVITEASSPGSWNSRYSKVKKLVFEACFIHTKQNELNYKKNLPLLRNRDVLESNSINSIWGNG